MDRGLKVLVAHNRYQLAGGEDSVVADEIALLRERGHEVVEFTKDNTTIQRGDGAIRAAISNVWSRQSYVEISRLITAERPDVLHVHNVTPLISGSIFWAADKLGVPVVQTLHNVRGMCLNGLFLREEKVCEDCKGRVPWRGVIRSCYRESLPASAALAASNTFHLALGTIQKRVDRFIALSEASRNRFIQGGYPAERVVVKPNFSAPRSRWSGARKGMLYVGRLSVEKGARVLAQALKLDPELSAQVRVVGTGPELDHLRAVLPPENLLGVQSREKVIELMASSRAVIVPSICYENFPKVIVEAFSVGTPVVASDLGALGELVVDGVTGFLAAPGDPHSLLERLRAASLESDRMETFGLQAYAEFQQRYTPARNYEMLTAIYSAAIGAPRKSTRRHT